MKMLERMFHLTQRGTTVRRELLGALTSFFSVAYILFVTPNYLSQTGMDYTGVLLATCLSSALACFLSAALDPKAHQSLRPRSGGLYKGIQPLSLQLQYTPLFSPQQQRIVHVQPSDS